MEERRLVTGHSTDPDRYRSYLLRLWREVPGAPWRCQVQCVGTGLERRFGRLAEMFEFLVADAAAGSEGQEGNPEISDAHGESCPPGQPDSTLRHEARQVGGAEPCG